MDGFGVWRIRAAGYDGHGRREDGLQSRASLFDGLALQWHGDVE